MSEPGFALVYSFCLWGSSDNIYSDELTTNLMKALNFEKDFFLRFSSIAEINTYIIVIVGLILIQLPIGIPYDFPSLYALAGFTILETILWYHVIGKRISVHERNFIESLIALMLITVFIAITGGVNSIFIVLPILPLLNCISSNKMYQNGIILILVEIVFGMFIFINPSNEGLVKTIFLMVLVLLADFGVLSAKDILTHATASITTHEATIEELTQMNKYKDEFVYMMTHELKSPITVIKGYLDLVKSDKNNKLSDKSMDMLAKAVDHTQNLGEIIDELLDISKIEMGKIVLSPHQFSLDELIQEIIDDLAFNAQSRNITIEFKNDKGKEITIHSDKTRIREIVINLVDNAIKYSNPGNVVSIHLATHNKRVEISVQDHGIGIPAEDQSKIFQKFFRAKNVYLYQGSGTGLGLYIVYRLVDLLKGYIQFNSVENKGTVFKVQLPLS